MGVYKWKDGTRFSADASLVAEELRALPEQTAAAALVAAEDESTELHKCVTWDDAEAAHRYRLEEMGRVIRSVVIVDSEGRDEAIEYRAFEYVTIQPEGDDEKPRRRFMDTPEILADDEFTRQVMREIKADIGELSRKAKMYRYLREQEMDTVQKHLDLASEAVTV